jgi:hypothetical protein
MHKLGVCELLAIGFTSSNNTIRLNVNEWSDWQGFAFAFKQLPCGSDTHRVTDTGRVCFGSCSVFGFLLVLLYQLQLAAA